MKLFDHQQFVSFELNIADQHEYIRTNRTILLIYSYTAQHDLCAMRCPMRPPILVASEKKNIKF